MTGKKLKDISFPAFVSQDLLSGGFWRVVYLCTKIKTHDKEGSHTGNKRTIE